MNKYIFLFTECFFIFYIVNLDQFNVLSQEYGKLINEQKLEKRYFVKIMIVGREHAGKTSLMRRLLKERFNENEQSTDGVDIVTRRCKINIKNGQWEIGKGKHKCR